MKKYPNRIYELRRKRKISQEHLAEVLNVTQSSISLYENRGNVPLDVLISAAHYFGVTLEYLLNLSDEETGTIQVSDDEYNLVMQYRHLSLQNKRLISDVVRAIQKFDT